MLRTGHDLRHLIGLVARSRTGRGTAGVALVAAALALAAAPAAGQDPGTVEEVALPGTDEVIVLAFVPPGAFAMGSPSGEVGRDEDEGPVHRVELPGFWMTVHEITQDQYAPYRHRSFDGSEGPSGSGSFDPDAVTRPSPPYEDPAGGMGEGDHPATGLTRWNALHYARWLSEKTGRLFRLPTEAEWEYACRAAQDGPWGDAGGETDLTRYGWTEANSLGALHPVGGKSANSWGIHDLLGNAAEWVMDGYDAGVYASRAGDAVVVSPLAGSPTRGQGVVRGGAFDDGPAGVRCADRLPESAAWKRRDPQIPKSRWWNTDAPHVGFRLVSPSGDHSPEEIRAYWNELLGG